MQRKSMKKTNDELHGMNGENNEKAHKPWLKNLECGGRPRPLGS